MTLAITLPSFFCTWKGRNWARHKALAMDILCMAVVSPLIRVRMNDAICAPKEILLNHGNRSDWLCRVNDINVAYPTARTIPSHIDLGCMSG
ncbi:conserved hypothetical protein [Mesorhizobium prunaredense]|uniref:Uncharacterized protein n=1 Tax=Mesorhizobium prunaredense TaxID=1631249 RepID=A0A1R3V4E6_9HYPH|nr:conserved hypothetical protein [Mesorhizobium prunaredense]